MIHRQIYPFRRFGLRRASADHAAGETGGDQPNADSLQEAGGARLWNCCQPARQEQLAGEFAEHRCETLRDAILDLQDAPIPKFPPGAAGALPPATTAEIALGRLLWTAWLRFRDRSLRELLSRGELSAGE